MNAGDGKYSSNVLAQILSFWHGREKPTWWLAGAGVCIFFVTTSAVQGQTSDPRLVDGAVFTNINQIYEGSLEQRSQPHRIQIEVVLYYSDPEWGAAWGECGGVPAYLPIFDCPTPLNSGQRVFIDGVIIPSQQRMLWDQTRVRILEEGVDQPAQTITNLSENPMALKGRLVLVEGLVDRLKQDPTHLSLNFLSGGISATVFVLKGTNAYTPHFKGGDSVRLKAVYAPQLDRDGKLGNLDLWVARPQDIEVVAFPEMDWRFALPVTPAERLQEDTPTNDLVRVEGTVRDYEPGRWVTIWDDTGQVMVQSKQTQPLRVGDQITAIGYPYVMGVHQHLHNGLYRVLASTNRPASTRADGLKSPSLRLAERVRCLNREEAARHLPVQLRAVVTWSAPGTPQVYVQDSSGGVCVLNPQWDAPQTAKPGTIVVVDGVTSEGDFVPVITNAFLRRAGWWNLNLQEKQPVTLEQAQTGLENGRWVEMRGYVRAVTTLGDDLRKIELTTLSGEFEVLVPSSRTLEDFVGSIVRVQGVCSAIANARHQLTGIRIWTPASKYILVEEPESTDVFAAPMRPLGSLRQFNMERTLNQRMRTAGTVVMHVPGRYLYVQDGADSVYALSQQLDPLHPGDRVDVVGFPGSQGRRFLLREAVYRRLAGGVEPAPVQLAAMRSVNLDFEGLLAQAEGTLLNTVRKEGETRLLVRGPDSIFEASLDWFAPGGTLNAGKLEPGSRLALVGIYEVQSDEYGQPRSFLIHLRSWNDVKLLERPPWWTLARLLWVLVGVLAVFLIGLVWGILITRKNALLRQAQAELQAANDQLGIRVAERTSELEAANTQLKQEITKQLKLEAQLRHSQKMEAVGQLAAGVAHDFNNILTVIKGNASLLQEQFQQNPPSAGSLPDISAAAERAARLVRQLLAFSRKQLLKPERLNLGRVVNHLEEMLKRLLGDHITLEVLAAPGLPPIRADLSMMEQIIMNLSVNARDAMPKGGRLTIRIESVTITPDDAHKITEIRPGLYVCLSVADTGCGIAPELLPRVFDPFFTTKEVGKGTGLGLATVYGIVKQHNGRVEVQSVLNQGTTFRIFLPADVDHTPSRDPSSPPETTVKKGTECVLVVEDEDHVRSLAVAVLRKNGYRVLEAASGQAALDIFQSQGSDIDLLFTDVMMPGSLLGDELATRLRATKPSLAVLFTSGYTPDANKPDAQGAVHFLLKPFTPAQMLTAIRQCLDGATVEREQPKT
jgi:two-component system, cell cycle sensor histidine kinase and response regulator CckA